MINITNPFSVETPEHMTAKDINDLFVPQTESFSLESEGHIFLHGHRGCGKSMMFRRLAPDCQHLLLNKEINELPFFGIYMSIKKTDIDLIDFDVLDGTAARIIIAEHVMVCYFLSNFFGEINKYCNINNCSIQNEINQFIDTTFLNILSDLGFDDLVDLNIKDSRFSENKIQYLIYFFDRQYTYYIKFLKKILMGFENKNINYENPIFSFYDTMLPLIGEFKKLSFIPSSPIYFLVDDADNLNLEQTQVLNTWVSYRTTDILSFKISTQMKYKSYLTQSGRRIETPHDYKELTYSKIQTGSSKESYSLWVKEISKKRLKLFSNKNPLIKTDPKEFFPDDIEQENKIRDIYDKYKSGELKGSSSRNNDNAYRYARPDYIKSLGGSSKNRNSYKYAGFEQLVHISSGVIRYFLDSASKMFAAEERNLGSCDNVNHISPSIQNKIIRDDADSLFFNQIDKIESNDNNYEKIEKLRNLINCIGALFYSALISTNSERKFFSFIISDSENISSELNSILSLGFQEGLLYESYIGAKDGLSRTKLYVMTRRLAPYFNIDPMGFSGYKSIKTEFLTASMNNPKAIINQLKSNGINVFTEDLASPQQQSLL